MDKTMFSTIDSTKLLSKIKRLVVVLLLITASYSHPAATEPTTGPSSAVSPPQKSQPTFKPALAVVCGCLLTALFLICFLFLYFRRYPEQQLALAAAATGSGGDRTFLKLATAPGLDPTVIASFTTFTYSAVKEIKVGQQVLECAVCLNEFNDHETLRLLPECCHVFHRECIDEWLALHVTCPVCRANLVPKPGQASMTESCFDQNKSTEDHVSVDVIDLKHDGSIKKLSRSYSADHSIVGRRIENVEKYTLRLPNALKNSVIKNPADGVGEISLKICVRSASANYVRESTYFG